MKYGVRTYILIACLSFVILTVVLFYLVYNTYELKNERYFYSEKSAILSAYGQTVSHDLMIAGGMHLMDSILAQNRPALEQLQSKDTLAFNNLKQKIADTLFGALAATQEIGAILDAVKKEKNISDSLEYALMLEDLEINIGDQKDVRLYKAGIAYPLILSVPQEADGVRIGGQLQNKDNQNRIVQLTVGSASPDISKLRYALYVEPVNRKLAILGQMAMTLVLALLSVLVVVILFFFTFRNWLRQKQLSEMKSDFINNITHEFNTPLTAILVANKSLQNERIIEKKENIHSLTGVIQRQTGRLQILFAQVMDIVSVNKMALKKKEFAVNSLLEELLLDYRLNLTNDQVTLRFNQDATQDRAMLDHFHFNTMINNILDNAIKYNHTEQKLITVSTQNQQGQLRIIIDDNGIGMLPETIQHLFEKFYRGKPADGQVVNGLGLGLYYVNQIVRAHDWNIFVESKPSQGSRFIIIIPIQEADR